MAGASVPDNDGWLPAHSAARGGHVAALQFIADSLGSLTPTPTEVPGVKPPKLADIAYSYNQEQVLNFLHKQVAVTSSTRQSHQTDPMNPVPIEHHEVHVRVIQ